LICKQRASRHHFETDCRCPCIDVQKRDVSDLLMWLFSNIKQKHHGLSIYTLVNCLKTRINTIKDSDSIGTTLCVVASNFLELEKRGIFSPINTINSEGLTFFLPPSMHQIPYPVFQVLESSPTVSISFKIFEFHLTL
jgi:hypothetical protein